MPLLRVNAEKGRLVLDRAALAQALQVLPADCPVIVMIHGYRFSPGVAGRCPHDHILSLTPDTSDRKAVSWPANLGCDAAGGLGIAFGWVARGSIWGAFRRAALAGRALADLLALVAALAPGRQVDVIAHSMGARVVLSALPHATPGVLGRIILLAAAEFRANAARAMATDAGRAVAVVNVTSRENDLFDFCIEALMAAGMWRSLSQGLAAPRPNWIDLQLDDPATLSALAARGHPLPGAQARVCHWSPYLRPGALRFYRALLEGQVPLPALAAALPDRQGPRWSRLLAWPATAGLPLPRDPA